VNQIAGFCSFDKEKVASMRETSEVNQMNPTQRGRFLVLAGFALFQRVPPTWHNWAVLYLTGKESSVREGITVIFNELSSEINAALTSNNAYFIRRVEDRLWSSGVNVEALQELACYWDDQCLSVPIIRPAKQGKAK
jgi:hypothetical protein